MTDRSTLRNLFHKPAIHTIGDIGFAVSKVAFDQFDDALALGAWLSTLDVKAFSVEQLNAIKAGTPERAALVRLLAGSLALVQPAEPSGTTEQREWPIQLQPGDIAAMPLLMVAEAVAVVLEVNADFFFQTLPKLLTVANRIQSIGSELLSNLSARATA